MYVQKLYLLFTGMGRMKDHQRFRGLLRLLILLLLVTDLGQTALKVLLNFIYNEGDKRRMEYCRAENFRGRKTFANFVAIPESFFHETWGVTSFGTAKANNPQKFSPRKSYFSPICESFIL